MPSNDVTPDDLARAFHETYERLAPQFGYETRPESAVPWDDVPESNKRLMTAVAGEVMEPLMRALREAQNDLAVGQEEAQRWYRMRENDNAEAFQIAAFERQRTTAAEKAMLEAETERDEAQRDAMAAAAARARLREVIEIALANMEDGQAGAYLPAIQTTLHAALAETETP